MTSQESVKISCRILRETADKLEATIGKPLDVTVEGNIVRDLFVCSDTICQIKGRLEAFASEVASKNLMKWPETTSELIKKLYNDNLIDWEGQR